jgi:CHAD domain-containing protein
MKARPVTGLDPGGTLADNAERIVRTRLDEVCSFMPKASDPEQVTALHDMRIAAKRLRYILELAGPALGKGASNGAREAKEIQTLLGELHDCDVMLGLIDAHRASLRADDVEAALALAPAEEGDLPASSVRALPNRLHHRGLEALSAYFSARRRLLYCQFARRWKRLESAGFRERILKAL